MTVSFLAPSALMLCQDCLHVRPYCESGHFGDYRCHCGGDFCGCTSCNDFAHGQGADFEKRQALDPKFAPSDPANAADSEQVKGRAPGSSDHASPIRRTEARAERTLELPPP